MRSSFPFSSRYWCAHGRLHPPPSTICLASDGLPAPSTRIAHTVIGPIHLQPGTAVRSNHLPRPKFSFPRSLGCQRIRILLQFIKEDSHAACPALHPFIASERGHGGGASRGIRDCSRRTRRKLVLGSKEGPGALLPKLPDHRLKPLLPLYGGAIASHEIWARNCGLRPPATFHSNLPEAAAWL